MPTDKEAAPLSMDGDGAGAIPNSWADPITKHITITATNTAIAFIDDAILVTENRLWLKTQKGECFLMADRKSVV